MTTQKRKVTTLPNFDRDVKRLKKRFPALKRLIGDVISDLETGETLGDRIPNIEYAVYKVRLPNPDAQKGKSGGFRVIYCLITEDGALLLFIYSKSDQTDVPIEVIIQLIDEFNNQSE